MNAEYKKLGGKPDPRAIKLKEKMKSFTQSALEIITKPKFDVFEVTRQTAHNPKEYPIFFIRDRQIFREGAKLDWRYFGSLFDIINGKINYKTTTSYMPEDVLQEF